MQLARASAAQKTQDGSLARPGLMKILSAWVMMGMTGCHRLERISMHLMTRLQASVDGRPWGSEAGFRSAEAAAASMKAAHQVWVSSTA